MASCSCGTNKNRTSHEVIEKLIAAESAKRSLNSIAGIGVFLVPRPDLGASTKEKVAVHDLTYAEAVLRGASCLAFKWFSYEFLADERGMKERAEISSNLTKACQAMGCTADSDCKDDGGGTDACFCDTNWMSSNYLRCY